MEAAEIEHDNYSKPKNNVFTVDKNKIQQSSLADSCPQLADLGVAAYSQDVFEDAVLEQIDEACRSPDDENNSEKNSDPLTVFDKHKIFDESNQLIRIGEATPFEIQTTSKKSSEKTTRLESENVSVVRNVVKLDVEEELSDGEIGRKNDSESDYKPSSAEESADEDVCEEPPEKKIKLEKRTKLRSKKVFTTDPKSFKDDGSDKAYEQRQKAYKKEKLRMAADRLELTGSLEESKDCIELKGGLTVPSHLWDKLFKYQRTGVRWLWELHRQCVGGIMGDEMGLGKTIQIIAFLGSLAYSKLPNQGFSFSGLGATLIICPTTVMHQWVREFHRWWPEFRVAVLHDTGSHNGPRHRLVSKMFSTKGVLITSYTTVTVERELILKHDWHYVILDEGHKIRNPDAQATLVVKQTRTPHRLILTGTPMQNSLKELWSVFDFVFPGRLGALPDFIREFGVPITQGGYANATPVQVQTAYRCACVLRETISPYLLRRTKADVKTTINLPTKREQVLFCRLTDWQRDIYQQYLTSRECDAILKGRLEPFVGLITLRKLCNHPDLVTGGPNKLGDLDEVADPSVTYGYWRRSGKMIVVEALLKLWKQQNHRVLLFSQSRQMLNILEKFIKTENYTYMRLDGSTAIGGRQNLVNKFNEDGSIFCLLLTTRVGGLGLNLTGADRVLIYDPDWNPSTDCQARERAWRIGQTRPVTVYRLLTTGTIEEKIYHRQIFKQFLTNRVLKDPKQRRFFKTNDLYELFTLTDDKNPSGTETETIFAGTGSEVKIKSSSKSKRSGNIFDQMAKEKKSKKCVVDDDEEDIDFVPANVDSDAKIDQQNDDDEDERTNMLRELAKKLSRELTKCKEEEVQKMEKRRRKKAKQKKNCSLDGVKISHLTKQSDYKPGAKEDDEATEERSKEQDDYVLSKLFKKSNVHSALKHDKIVESGGSDYSLVENEASKVASQAVKALSESRKRCNNAYSGIPTWTGKHGGGCETRVTPRFGTKTRKPAINNNNKKEKKSSEKTLFGGTDLLKEGNSKESGDGPLSSRDLLAAIRQRNVTSMDNSSDDEAAASSGVVVPPPQLVKTNSAPELSRVGSRYDGVLTELRHFVAFGAKTDGRASTEEILARFGGRVALQDSAVFKSLLRKICDFNRSVNGQGVWILKTEFR